MKISLLCTAALSALIAGAAAADDRPDLTVAVTSNPTRLDPMSENSNVNSRVSQNVLDRLIHIDFANNGALVPGLATSWDRIDGRSVEFKLRENVVCHNGEPFDASDVAFTFGPERFMDDDAPGPGRSANRMSAVWKGSK